LAGETLHFKGNILEVREATEEEIKFGDAIE
jgi:FKBP-type peptidyl-prolyl cis-trans isomerase 2